MTADSDQSPGEAEPDPSWSGLRGLARAGNLEYDRVLFFSDAIFAIAITLLVLDIHVPSSANASAGKALSAGVPRITSFVISFLVIGMFWMGHHRIFRLITGLDRPLIALNLLFLGTIAFMPYPTALLRIGNSLERPAVIFYALCISLAGATEYAIWAYASTRGWQRRR
ncbi:MAG TPA: TMEM175 family protein [Streptosporangiaceae bacterium]|nr:TMEM175 family protein [Streptosporangiaceae bacterium]